MNAIQTKASPKAKNRETYARLRKEACELTGRTKEQFDGACRDILPPDFDGMFSLSDAYVAAAHEVLCDWATPPPSKGPVREDCTRCDGKGEYIVPDYRTGRPRSLGTCFRCNGTGMEPTS